MAFVNRERNEITAKIVYYGPGLSGKTTCFHQIYKALPPANKGKLLSLATNIDRTIYFDFLPLQFHNLSGLDLRIQLYTVPGQVRFDATRRMVLRDVDAIVFVADMQQAAAKPNQESMKNLFDNLKELDLDLQEIPHVIQYNKEDLPNLLSLDTLNANLNIYKAPARVTCALSGKGVMDALKTATKLLVADIKRRRVIERQLAEVARKAEQGESAEATKGGGDESPRKVARRLLHKGIRPPIARASPVSMDRPPSTETLERHLQEGMFEEVTSLVTEPPPESKSDEDPAENDQKRIVVFADKASVLESGIHRRDNFLDEGDLLGVFGDEEGADKEIEASLEDLPDDPGPAANADSAAGFSLSGLLPEGQAQELLRGIESLVAEGRFDDVAAAMKRLLDEELSDAALFSPSAGPLGEASKIQLLGLRYSRYLKLREIVDGARRVDLEAALFGIHFLLDVELAKRELTR